MAQRARSVAREKLAGNEMQFVSLSCACVCAYVPSMEEPVTRTRINYELFVPFNFPRRAFSLLLSHN